MSIPWFTASAEAAGKWRQVRLGADILPGISKVGGRGLKRKIEKKAAKGSDGGTITDNGRDLAEVTITNTTWTADHWAELQRIFPLIEPNRDGGPRTPVEVYHPLFELCGIRQLYIHSIGIPSLDDQGVLTIQMGASRWAPAPKPVKKAAGSGSTGTNVDDELNALTQALTATLIAGDYEAAAKVGNLINELPYDEK